MKGKKKALPAIVSISCSSVTGIDIHKDERALYKAKDQIEQAFARMRPEDLKLLKKGLRTMEKIGHFPHRTLAIGDTLYVNLPSKKEGA